MEKTSFHLRCLVIVLLLIGLLVMGYQIFVLKIPVTKNEIESLWNVDLKINFNVTSSKKPVKVKIYIPPFEDNYTNLSESFIANNYGKSIIHDGDNRQVVLSVRRAKGNKQTLYYRALVNQRFLNEKIPEKGESYRETIPMSEAELAAAQAIYESIKQQSADVETFISETIKFINLAKDSNVLALIGKGKDIQSKIDAIDKVLSVAHIPMVQVNTINLTNSKNPIQVFVRSFNEEKWLYFNPETGASGLPANHLIWWFGKSPIVTIDGGTKAQLNFAFARDEINAIRLAKMTNKNTVGGGFLDYSLYGLPLMTQQTFQILIMIPFGVLVILILRNLIGIQTLGTFTPVLIALAFRETGLAWGIAFFAIVTTLGLMLRSYLEHLRLQMLPRLSVVLTFVVTMIGFISLISHRSGFDSGLSLALFPMVILTMSIERLSICWEERGAANAMKAAIGTLFAASLSHLLMKVPPLVYFVFTFPTVLLLLVAFMLLMGRYHGYRLTELLRFKALLGK